MNKRLIYGLLILTILVLNTNIFANTYYVSKSGNDSNSGLSWGSAWTSITKVNNAIASGDTIFFGTGIWRGTVLEAMAGTLNDRTVYACSSFADVNGAGEYHFAQIYGSDSLTGWTSHSGSVYQVPFTATGMPQLFQGDSVLWRQTSLGAVNGPGKWFYDGSANKIYAWAYGNGNPQNQYPMEVAQGPVVDMGAVSRGEIGQDHITFYGLRFKYANLRLFELTWIADNDHYDYIHFIKCHISHVMGDQTSNPGLIYAGGGPDASLGDYNYIHACSLGYAWAIDPTTFVSTGNKGSGVIIYKQRHLTIDSCTFYGFFKEAAIFFKCAYGDQGAPWSDSNVIAYNNFNNAEGGKAIGLFGIWRNLDVYGNVFNGVATGIYSFYDDTPRAGLGQFYNNTFYNVGTPIFGHHTGAGHTIPINNEFKYNVVYHTNDQEIALDYAAGDSGWIDINWNMYYTGGNLTLRKDGGGTAWTPAAIISLSNWINVEGLDQNSTFTTDPVLADPFNQDFRRLNASSEMWNVFNNDTFTVYGAMQPNGDTIPPNQVIDLGVINITDTSATVEWSTSIPSTSQVRYGLTPSFGQATATDPSYLLTHSMDLFSLFPDTLYYYQTVSIDTLNRVSYGQINSFRTLVSSDSTGPVISLIQATQITDVTATVLWATDESATSQVEYGTSLPLTLSTINNPTLLTSHGIGLTGLSPGTTYFFRVRSTDAPGNETISDTASFVTQATGAVDSIAPILSNIVSSNIDSISATINWSTDEPATSIVEYGFNTSYGNYVGDSTILLMSHHVNLSNLLSGVVYHYRVRSKDGAGNESFDVNRTFTTQTSGGSASVNLALGIIPTVDGSGSGFNPSKVTDGTKDPFDGSVSSWVSVSNSNPHWIDIDFETEKIVEQVIIYWPWGTTDSDWLTSQTVEVQNFNGSGFDSVMTISNSTNDSVTIVDVGDFSSTRVRLYQNANEGSTSIPTILALTEVEMIGYSSLSTGTGSPSAGIEPKAFPNPFQPAIHTYLTIDNLPLDASIIIMNVSGQIIKRIENVQTGSLQWDGTNESQSAVASGVYLWFLENTDSNGKIVLVN